ncbi:hypothetical protein AV691_004257 [Salmonella enterica subsp. enterica serovar 4,[5],12:i:-]|nr:hypothetical protein [Salmonella enterica subsp. enterica serovar 4,[5],12:i:-]
MKKMLAVIALSMAVVGCSDEPKTYICGSEAFEVTSDYMKVVGGRNKGVTIDNVSGNEYKLLTPIGSAYYKVNKNTIDISVGAFKHTLKCEVK